MAKKKIKKTINNDEYLLHRHISEWMRLKYKGTLFHSDTGSGVRLSIGNAKKIAELREVRGYPDFYIFTPRGKYHGMVLEFKIKGTKIKSKTGRYYSEHLREQAKILKRFQNEGYAAAFAVGDEQAKKYIDWYMSL